LPTETEPTATSFDRTNLPTNFTHPSDSLFEQFQIGPHTTYTMGSIFDFATIVSLIGAPRHLQTLPDYTSPPLEEAISYTPLEFRDDAAVDAARDLAAAGNCTVANPTACQMLFPPAQGAIDSGTAKVGVLFYGGALVDPRGYSPIAAKLSQEYGFAVSIPIFANDLAFSGCDSGRIPLAAAAFPDIEKWVLAGHSFGGIAAQADLWSLMNDSLTFPSSIAGLVLVASYIRQDLGCGDIDFSGTSMPAASIMASLDGIINQETATEERKWLPTNTTFDLNIFGGNHGYFGTYDYSERSTLLPQFDGSAIITRAVQQDLTMGAIANVAARSSVGLPRWDRIGDVTTPAPSPTSAATPNFSSSAPTSPPRTHWYRLPAGCDTTRSGLLGQP
jgi:hypothetical protein